MAHTVGGKRRARRREVGPRRGCLGPERTAACGKDFTRRLGVGVLGCDVRRVAPAVHRRVSAGAAGRCCTRGAHRAAPAGPRACCPSGPHPSARRPACRRHPAFLRLPARVPTLLPSCSGSDSRLLGRLPRRSGSRPRLEVRGTGGGARPAGSHRPAAAMGAAQSRVLRVPRPALPCGSPLAPVRHVARHSSQLHLAASVRPRTLGLTLPGEIKVP